jgi:PAS domain S-box-containing protein
VEANRDLASWLVGNRPQIEKLMTTRLGPAAPNAAAPETEALRRFRSFSASALLRGKISAPALDGLRPNERRVMALLGAWKDAASSVAGDQGSQVRDALTPLIAHFRACLRTTHTSRRARGAPRASRRAVVAAIDRVADAFLAIDSDTGKIADANPAAGSLLGVNRDALLEVDAMSFVPKPARSAWWRELDAVAESEESRHFRSVLMDANGDELDADVTLTSFATRGRTLALVMARPVLAESATSLQGGAKL